MSPDFQTTLSQLQDLLEGLVRSTGALTILLITKEGTILSEAGDTRHLDTTAAAALVAGMFAATREVARMVGENQFSVLLQQGENKHIHISVVTNDSLMVILFEDYQTIGMVRHQARKAGKDLAEILQASRARRRAAQEIRVSEIKAYVLDRMDKIFSPR